MLYEDDLPSEFDSALSRVARDLLAKGDGDEILAKYTKYVDDPVGFFREVLGVAPWESEDPDQHGQADLIRAVGECDRVACRSGHKIGKSLTAVGLALWFICTRKNARVLLTAPSFNQVKSILWKELDNLFRERGLAARFGADLPLDPATGFHLANGNDIKGISTKTKENLAGFSGASLFFVVDEGSGFPDDLWTVLLKGNAAGGAKIFTISNPTRTSGWFFELFRKRPANWRLFAISSENTPNVRSGQKLVPGLAERPFIEEMREASGPDYENDSDYMIRVKGEFPPQGTDAVIGVRAVENAQAKWRKMAPPTHHEGQLVLGVDCARYGNDDNVIQPLRGSYAWMPESVDTSLARNSTTLTAGQMVADEVVRTAITLRQAGEKVRVNIDGIGVGSSVVDHLKVCGPVKEGWMHLCDLNVGEKADESVKVSGEVKADYQNLRSQLWFSCAAWLKEGGAIPEHEKLGGELLAATYTFDERGRKKVESKDKMRAVLGKSPDYADALCMATYRGERGGIANYTYESAKTPRHGGGGTGGGGSFGFV